MPWFDRRSILSGHFTLGFKEITQDSNALGRHSSNHRQGVFQQLTSTVRLVTDLTNSIHLYLLPGSHWKPLIHLFIAHLRLTLDDQVRAKRVIVDPIQYTTSLE